MRPNLFINIRRFAATRAMRIVSVLVFLMCTVTWVAQSVSAVNDNPKVPGSPAALAMQAEAQTLQASVASQDKLDCADADDCDGSVVALVALDETHDIKLFFLREFTHLLQPVVGRLPRNRDFGATARMSSETFRPPDSLAGVQEQLLSA